MTNEKMLELVNSVLNEEGNAFLELVKAKEVLKRDILLECGKKAGKGNLQKVALKILKRSPESVCRRVDHRRQAILHRRVYSGVSI